MKLNLKAAGDEARCRRRPADHDHPPRRPRHAVHLLYSLITACQAQGFRKFALKAMTRADPARPVQAGSRFQ